MNSNSSMNTSDYYIDDFLKEDVEDLYQNAPCGYLSLLPDRTITGVNNTLLKWLGYTREELMHIKKFPDLVSPSGKLFYEIYHCPLQWIQGFVSELNYDLQTKTGEYIPCLVTCTVQKDPEGNVLFVRTIVFNITERKKYEIELLRAKQEAERAARYKSDFLSLMSHEIRTPLNAIIATSHLLRANNADPEQVENLDILGYSAENLLNLVNNILDYNKMEAGMLKTDLAPFDLYTLSKSIIQPLKLKALNKGVKIDLAFDHNIPRWLVGDRVKLSQILINLISNAVKFTEQGAIQVCMRVESSDENKVKLSFSVSDTGIGIAPDRMSIIFREFEQAESETSAKYGGTGLGLAITKKLVELLGGAIDVHSELLKGTVFSFALEFPVSTETDIPADDKPFTPTSLKGTHVLIVEDHQINALLLGKFLKLNEVTFDHAMNGKEALVKIKETDYDLILMDLQMPELNGFETASTIRSMDGLKYKEVPIIALSASSFNEEKDKVLDAGMNDFLGKPFDPKVLLKLIRMYLKKNNA